MKHKLSIDEYEALEQVSKLPKMTKPSICINRNVKRLTGIKLVAYRKDGGLELTETGREALFIKQCIDGLRAVAADPGCHLSDQVATFLGKKGHIVIDAASGLAEISERGRESLADIDAGNAANARG
jgi:hypothetical protein